MEPRIQYAKTRDGVSIAFWTLGEGEPLITMPTLPMNHLQLEWQREGLRRWYETLAENGKVVRFDPRGAGLSDRDAPDYGLDGFLLDLEGVADHLGLDSFALLAASNAGPVAITYAARFPDRVSRLILDHAWTRPSDWARSPQLRALSGLLDRDWETYTETWARIGLGWSSDDATFQAELTRESITPEVARHWARTILTFDVTELLPGVQAPTLVMYSKGYRFFEQDVATRLASRIPNAELAIVEGAWPKWSGDLASRLQAIERFLGRAEPRALATADVVTILFTDLASSTELTQRLGDAQAQELVRTHNAIVRDALTGHGGSEVKHTGDGIMASFSTASSALDCAVAIQRAVAVRDDAHLRVYIGLNAGEPIAEDADLFGTTVQLARRICDHAQAGQILASNVVRELAAGKGHLFSDTGDVMLKGFEDPVRLYEVRW